MADERTIEEMGLGWFRPTCYFCDQPIQDGDLACQLEVDDVPADAHKKCVDEYYENERIGHA